jgi:hypothetical protein
VPLSTIRSSAEIRLHQGEVVQVHGTYGVENLGRYSVMIEKPDGGFERVTNIATITFGDNGLLELEGRPIGEMKALTGSEVVVIGRLRIPNQPPDGLIQASSSLPPVLVDIISVEVVPG